MATTNRKLFIKLGQVRAWPYSMDPSIPTVAGFELRGKDFYPSFKKPAEISISVNLVA